MHKNGPRCLWSHLFSFSAGSLLHSNPTLKAAVITTQYVLVHVFLCAHLILYGHKHDHMI